MLQKWQDITSCQNERAGLCRSCRVEGENDRLSSHFILLNARLNRTYRNREEGIITLDQFEITQNRIYSSVKNFIQNLDKHPVEKKNPQIFLGDSFYDRSNQMTENGLLPIILFIQVLILIGIGVLIYLSMN